MNRVLEKYICTLCGLGYMPASGTFASVLTCCFIYSYGYVTFGLALLVSVVGWFCVRRYLHNFDDVHVDPPHVVIDEVVGQLWAFVDVPLSLSTIVVGFCLFRIFDIMKPGFIKKAESLPGAWGVIMDDVWAGLLTMVILRVWGFYGLA